MYDVEKDIRGDYYYPEAFRMTPEEEEEYEAYLDSIKAELDREVPLPEPEPFQDIFEETETPW